MDPDHETNTRDVYARIVDRCDAGSPFAVAVVLQAQGSTPCPTGARAIFDATGLVCGTIGGGPVEAEAQRRAGMALQRSRLEIFDFNLEGGNPDDGTPICGGRLRVLIDPQASRHRTVYTAAAEARHQRCPGVLLTFLRGHTPEQVEMQFLQDPVTGQTIPAPGAEFVRSTLREEKSARFAGEEGDDKAPVEILVEPVVPRPRLLIVGGGHVGQAVAFQADFVGFETVVLDDREEFTRPERFPRGVQAFAGDMVQSLARFPLEKRTSIVILTRGHQLDAAVLAACVRTPAGYIGMIGSRRKISLMRQDFIDRGLATEKEFDRVHAPVGLNLGAVTVAEIALSIVAQLVAVRRRGKASRSLKGL